MRYDTDGLCRDSESHKNAPEYSKHPIATPIKKSNIPFHCQPGNVHLNQNQKDKAAAEAFSWMTS